MLSSTLVTCLVALLLVVPALVLMCWPSASTRRRTCSMTAWRRRMRRGSWPRGSAARRGRRTAMCSALVRNGHVAVPAPTGVFTVKLPVPLIARVRAHAAASGRTLSAVVAQALEEFWRGLAESIRDGERAGGRDRVRLRSPAGRGSVGGLPHPCPRTTLAQRARRSGSECSG